jgi:membrane-bound lytic murein transglycosylase
MKLRTLYAAAGIVTLLSACAPSIRGTIRLVDANNKPIPIAIASPEGAVVNMINTSAAVEQASYSVTTTADGKFESAKDVIKQGKYQVEVTHIGFQTETRTVEVGTFSSPTVDVSLQKIPEGRRKSIRGSRTDEDKIINPGEVNIQPPSM